MHELLIAIEFSSSDWSRKVLNLAKTLSGVKVQQWSENIAEKSASTVKSVPDIIIIGDDPNRVALLNRIRDIKTRFPQSFLFVVSANQDPQQIINAMKAGTAEYLVDPVDEAILRTAIEEVRGKSSNASSQAARGEIYSFISSKGGIGATVLAVNTAVSLAMSKTRSVALFDMSLQSGDASVLLDLSPQTTILDISRNFRRLDLSFLRGSLTEHVSGLNFLAAPPDPEDSEEVSAEHIAKTLDLAAKVYDQVFLDCSSMHISAGNIEAFKRSKKIFIITDMSLPSIRNTVRLFKLIHKLGVIQDKIEIVINRYIKSAPLSLATIEKNFVKPVYWLVPNDFADVVTSINQGAPLVKMKPTAALSKNIEEFGKKILRQLDDSEYRGIRGKFGRKI